MCRLQAAHMISVQPTEVCTLCCYWTQLLRAAGPQTSWSPAILVHIYIYISLYIHCIIFVHIIIMMLLQSVNIYLYWLLTVYWLMGAWLRIVSLNCIMGPSGTSSSMDSVAYYKSPYHLHRCCCCLWDSGGHSSRWCCDRGVDGATQRQPLQWTASVAQ